MGAALPGNSREQQEDHCGNAAYGAQGTGDYEIVVKGFIIKEGNEFPEQKVTMLRRIYEQQAPVSVKCPLTDIFLLRPDRSGSDQVVLSELKLPGVTGVKNVWPYELHMISDAPFNLLAIS